MNKENETFLVCFPLRHLAHQRQLGSTRRPAWRLIRVYYRQRHTDETQFRYQYRAFSHDVMLSSNMAASIATEINIHLLWLPVLRELFHSWFKRVMIACTHVVHDCPGYPGQSAHSDGLVGKTAWRQWKRSIGKWRELRVVWYLKMETKKNWKLKMYWIIFFLTRNFFII